MQNTESLNKTPVTRRESERWLWVDYARGLAIILVVYRHTMVGLDRSGMTPPKFLYNIQEYMLNFRMPVFFVLSGIFLAKSLKKYASPLLVKKKANTLLYPYFLWTIIFISLQILLSNYTNSNRTYRDYFDIILQPRNLDHMWYLLALFNCSFIYLVLPKWVTQNAGRNLLLALIMHVASYFVRDYSLISDPLNYYIFLVAGTVVYQYMSNVGAASVASIRKVLLITLPFFVAGQIFWFNMRPGDIYMIIPFLLIILVACVFFYCVCVLLHKAGIALWLNIIGQHSLYIYILHILIISSFRILCLRFLGITNVYMVIAGSLFLGITIPILFYKSTRKWGVERLFSLEKKAAPHS